MCVEGICTPLASGSLSDLCFAKGSCNSKDFTEGTVYRDEAVDCENCEIFRSGVSATKGCSCRCFDNKETPSSTNTGNFGCSPGSSVNFKKTSKCGNCTAISSCTSSPKFAPECHGSVTSWSSQSQTSEVPISFQELRKKYLESCGNSAHENQGSAKRNLEQAFVAKAAEKSLIQDAIAPRSSRSAAADAWSDYGSDFGFGSCGSCSQQTEIVSQLQTEIERHEKQNQALSAEVSEIKKYLSKFVKDPEEEGQNKTEEGTECLVGQSNQHRGVIVGRRNSSVARATIRSTVIALLVLRLLN